MVVVVVVVIVVVVVVVVVVLVLVVLVLVVLVLAVVVQRGADLLVCAEVPRPPALPCRPVGCPHQPALKLRRLLLDCRPRHRLRLLRGQG